MDLALEATEAVDERVSLGATRVMPEQDKSRRGQSGASGESYGVRERAKSAWPEPRSAARRRDTGGPDACTDRGGARSEERGSFFGGRGGARSWLKGEVCIGTSVVFSFATFGVSRVREELVNAGSCAWGGGVGAGASASPRPRFPRRILRVGEEDGLFSVGFARSSRLRAAFGAELRRILAALARLR